jgi:endo-1,4-beta-D-glucanase Y
MRVHVLLWLLLIFIGRAGVASPACFPFPQQMAYSFGIKPTSQTQATMNSDCQRIYQAFHKYNVTNSGCPPGGYRVHCGPGSLNYQTRSEGIAWGMLITVYMDNATNNTKSLFDGFDTYRKAYTNANGFMNWLVNADGTLASTGPAIEADQNMALALLMAHYQWGSDSGTDYRSEALSLISNLMEYCVVKPQYAMKPGDTWGGLELLHPCAWDIGYYGPFARFTGDARWTSVLNTHLNLIGIFYTNYNTGLMPHWCKFDGSPTGNSDPYFADYTYEYDACQAPLKYGLYYLWNGASGSVLPYGQCKRLAGWINTTTGGNPNSILDNYNLVGTPGPSAQWNSTCFVATFGVAAMSDPVHQAWLNTIYNNLRLRNPSATDYYNTLIQMISMLVMTGNLPDLMALSLQSDSDGDGLPDNWEILHFGSVTNSAGFVPDDYDADGFNDGSEYIAGTDPADAQSYLKLAVTRAGQNLIFSCPTLEASGTGYFGKRRYYDLLTRTNLTTGAWQSVQGATNLAGVTGTFSYTNAAPVNAAYYVVRTRLQ